MPFSTLTTKGQATIPKPIRKLLGIRAHDRIAFHIRNGRVWIEGQRHERKSLFGKYAQRGRKPVSVAEMNEAVKRRAVE